MALELINTTRFKDLKAGQIAIIAEGSETGTFVQKITHEVMIEVGELKVFEYPSQDLKLFLLPKGTRLTIK